MEIKHAPLKLAKADMGQCPMCYREVANRQYYIEFDGEFIHRDCRGMRAYSEVYGAYGSKVKYVDDGSFVPTPNKRKP
jgi:hypothetical protein